MYTRFFGLQEKPFAIAPDPRYLYMSELHREALAHLLYGLKSDGCIILLTGDVGTGKTTVCRFLFDQLPDTTDTAIILNPKLTAREMLVTICDDLAISPSVIGSSIKAYLDALNLYLIDAHSRGRTTAVFIDEAQNLNMSVLEQLRLLTNLETDKEKLLKIVLLGQTELRNLLERPEATQINQRVTSRYHLLPLEKHDVFSYIQHRLEIAGNANDLLFTEKALQRIFHYSGGIPRIINTICDRALLGAYAGDKYQVDSPIINRAALEVLGEKGYRRANKGPFSTSLSTVSLFGIALLAFTLLAVSFFLGQKHLNMSLAPVAPPTPMEKKLPAPGPTLTIPAKKTTDTSSMEQSTSVSLQKPVSLPGNTKIQIAPMEIE